jgi:acyl-coenzyme A thioesterase 13
MSHLAKVQKIAAFFLKDRVLFNKISVIEAENGKIKAFFLVEESHLNINRKLFGGFTASLIDIGGSLAIASKLESPNVGVSTDMSVSFQSSAAEGDKVLIIGECSKAGKNVAFTTVKLFVNDKQIAHGSHSKFMGAGNIK